ncbi:hypothetical protein PLICRDRAFT_53174 [Plicaturopsis crispa FD-325 SS-3]|nr:hypothetical protein PLICRDRAFT_53174 [Plicaturopsis crispa FD-325 SS-3]
MRHRYRGHRAESFAAIDVPELVELRARQRTFHGAYRRTALGNLGYALAVIKLFDARFYRIGLLFALLSAMLFALSFVRARHSKHDFADHIPDESTSASPQPLESVGQRGRVYGKPFYTAGWVVIAVTGAVAVVEIGLFWLVLKI